MTAESAYDRVTRLLAEKTGYAGRNGSWRCPAHDDSNPSLTVTRGDRGVILCCHRDCTVNAVTAALGIRLADLFDQPAERGNGNGTKPVIDRTYPYVDEHGQLLYEVVRFTPKDFRQRRPDGNGGWINNVAGVRNVVYNLPGVLAAKAAGVTIYVVEGEKDCDALDRAGEIATCNPGGAGKWRPEHTDMLAGAAEVIIVADKDKPGRQHARTVADALRPRVGAVRIVEALTGKDAADHLGAGHNVDNFQPIDLEAGVEQPRTEPTDDADDGPTTGGLLRLQTLKQRLLDGTQLDQLPPPQPLIDGILTCDTIAALYGPPGVGKSFVKTDWALSVATGTWWLGHQVHQGPVIYIAAEGQAGLGQRKRAWEKAHNVQVNGHPIYWEPMPVNLRDPEWVEGLALLAAEIRPVLIVIDTLARCMPGGDENSSRDMGAIVEAADRLRLASHATILFGHHTPKETDTLRGHSSLEGAVETVISAARDGQTITLKSKKQKDLPDFEPIRLHLREVDESCAIYCQNGLAVSEDLTAAETTILDALGSSAGSDGLSASTLIRITELAERSAYRAIKALLKRGAIVNVATDRRPKYVARTETTQ